MPERRTKVAIIGFTQHSLKAPWLDETWELWGLNDLYHIFDAHNPEIWKTDRVRWFQLHQEDAGTSAFATGARDPEHVQWLEAGHCPIYMWQPKPRYPTSVAYPMLQMLDAFPRKYFNNSISWELALAIAEGFQTIGLFGVDMALDGVHGESEYSWQRPSVEYFVGIAEGRGIEVVIPEESEILKCGYLYGWDNPSVLRAKMLSRLQQLEAQEVEATNQYEAMKRQLHEVRGAKHDVAWVLRNYLPGDGPTQDVPRTARSIIPAAPVVIPGRSPEVPLPTGTDGRPADPDGKGRAAVLELMKTDQEAVDAARV